MRNKGTLWLDCDGVLLDYSTAFMKYIMDNYKIGVPATELTEYSLAKYFSNTKQMYDIMREFGEHDTFSKLKPLMDVRAIEAARIAGFDVRVITYMPPSNTTQMQLLRLKNLAEVYGNVFNEVVFLEIESDVSKVRYITNHGLAPAAFVEDHPGIIQDALLAIRAGIEQLEVFAVQHSYNENMLRTSHMAQVPRSKSATVAAMMALEWLLPRARAA